MFISVLSSRQPWRTASKLFRHRGGVRPAFTFTAGDKILDSLPEHLHPVDPHVEFRDVLNQSADLATRKFFLVPQAEKIPDLPDGQATLAAKVNEPNSVHVIRVVRAIAIARPKIPA
jgi:hypothetical protein